MVTIVAPGDLEAAQLNLFWHNRMQEKLTPIKAAGRFDIHPRKVRTPMRRYSIANGVASVGAGNARSSAARSCFVRRSVSAA